MLAPLSVLAELGERTIPESCRELSIATAEDAKLWIDTIQGDCERDMNPGPTEFYPVPVLEAVTAVPD